MLTEFQKRGICMKNRSEDKEINQMKVLQAIKGLNINSNKKLPKKTIQKIMDVTELTREKIVRAIEELLKRND